MKITRSFFVILLLALITATVSRFLFSGWFNIIPWIVITLLIGYFSRSRNECFTRGFNFGFFLFLFYTLEGFAGKTDFLSLVRIAAFGVALGMAGGLAGITGALIAYWARKKINS